ncbi:MBL fold metallo-hydrolase [Magnetospirillum sulfuroxidans]|uniref:MBL fold metallo-hydrolase n=1 Tax=Magnetospirillum sulfuroxidans TaxID=611300 RepID=A0ABS5I7Z9_9PROT|nr:MBL fold metallo-hydrolase [Magnetospirillum sulfuroxidans]MBR9970570.1 MBL fold metallo-hydrolase [Magnetospirillum sulfuroxidans]
MNVTILGCGPAGGVPSISRGWGACDPRNPRNRRRRPSILVDGPEGAILVDSSPDCREQLLDAGINRLAAVLYTHDHADHMHGIDDLREINRVTRQHLPIHATPEVLAVIRTRFPYVIGGVGEGQSIYKPMLDLNPINGPFRAGGLDIVPFDQDHGYCRSTGFRFGPLAYSTDVVELPEASFEALAGIDTWIVGCLNYQPHPTHAHLDKVLQWIERVRPRQAFLTHMTPNLDYDTLCGMLPPHVRPAHDGMVIVACNGESAVPR